MTTPTVVTTWRVWWSAIRPRTLPAAIGPIAVGTAIAIKTSGAHWPAAAASLMVALTLQIVANLTNDLFDFRRGADAVRTGPVRVTQSGLVTPRAMATAVAIGAALAIAFGLLLVWRGGWPILLLGVAALLSAILYTAGPVPLAYHGLGDVFAFCAFGLIGVAGTAYVQTLTASWLAIAMAIPSGCLVTAIIVVNNLRDLETDWAVGKRTLAVRIGRSATIVEYQILLVAAYLTPLCLWSIDDLGRWWWLPWLSIPMAVRLGRRVRSEAGPGLNSVLAGTARLSLIFAILFSGAIAL